MQGAFDDEALKEELTKEYIKFEPVKKATNTQVAKFTTPFSETQVVEGYFSLHPDLPVVAMDYQHHQNKAKPFKKPYAPQLVSVSSVKPLNIKLDDPALKRLNSEEKSDDGKCLVSLAFFFVYLYISCRRTSLQEAQDRQGASVN